MFVEGTDAWSQLIENAGAVMALLGVFGILLTLGLTLLVVKLRGKRKTPATDAATAPPPPTPSPASPAPATEPSEGSATIAPETEISQTGAPETETVATKPQHPPFEPPASPSPSGHQPSGEGHGARPPREPFFDRRAAAESENSPEESNEYAIVEVYYGTDRAKIKDAQGLTRYSSERGEFSYGGCRVSVPKTHRMGALEGPRLWRLEFSPDPVRHVMLREVLITDRENFFEALNNRVQQSAAHQAFLFVHGYNVSFEDAARRTAQIAYDLNFDGAAIFYSWPSQGDVAGYAADEANVEWATPNLQAFIADILQQTAPTRLHLIAHSMGSRALTQALLRLRSALPEEHKAALKEVILAAPDIDADVFLRDIVPALRETGARITLYAAHDDKALEASQKVHRHPRAGDLADLSHYPPEIDIIDASHCDTSFLGHTPFSGRSMISDMFALLTHGHGPAERLLREVRDERGRYWRIES